MKDAIGFIGFGEAGSAIAKGLVGAGAPKISAYDLAVTTADGRERFRGRAAAIGVDVCETLADLAASSEIIFSAVVSSVAVDVARSAAPHLEPWHTYVDLNSTSPAIKQEIAAIIGDAGAQFVEGAVMAAVPPLAHKVPVLMCGEAAPDLIARLSPYGMCLEDFGPEIGRATATKMFRSIMVKGLEALFLECALGSSKYGVTERVLDSVGMGYPGLDWNQLAHYLIGRTAIHGDRRGHEMEEVAATLRGLDIEPIMADAAARRILYCAGLGLKSKFGNKPPANYEEVITAIQEAERR